LKNSYRHSGRFPKSRADALTAENAHVPTGAGIPRTVPAEAAAAAAEACTMSRAASLFGISAALAASVFLCACSSAPAPLPDKADAKAEIAAEITAARSYSLAQKKLLDIIDDQNRLFERSKEKPPMRKDDFLTHVNRIESMWKEYFVDNPDDVDGLIIYGKFLRTAGSTSAAYAEFAKADKLDPNIAVVKQQLAVYEAENGLCADAYAHMSAAVKLEPDNPIYLTQMGDLIVLCRTQLIFERVFKQDELDAEMQRCYRRASELRPDDLVALRRYAQSFYDVRRADWNLALKLWDEILSRSGLNLDRQTALANKARVLIELNRDVEAERILREQVNLPSLLDARGSLLLEIERARKQSLPSAENSGTNAVPSKKNFDY